MIKALALLAVLLPSVASAQDKPSPPGPLRGMSLAYQQLGVSIEAMAAYYEAKIEELKKLCGDPCKDK